MGRNKRTPNYTGGQQSQAKQHAQSKRLDFLAGSHRKQKVAAPSEDGMMLAGGQMYIRTEYIRCLVLTLGQVDRWWLAAVKKKDTKYAQMKDGLFNPSRCKKKQGET